ncbi:MAG TPA: DUF202 domain-containing protein [Longimicrobium sp.]|jgi:putative membrane protein
MASETELRDQLALDRTFLANERTLLAYVRTALALAGAGAGLLGFVETPAARSGGWVLLVAGALVMVLGIWRFLTVRRHLHRNRTPAAQA